MIGSGIILDPSGLYRVQPGFDVIQSDTDVLSLGSLENIWAKGKRATGAVQRLAKERDLETLSLRPPSEWFISIGLPQSLVTKESASISQFFTDEPPTTDSEARDRVRLWVGSSPYSAVLGLLENADLLLSAFVDEGMDALKRDLLLWVAKARGDVGSSSFVSALLVCGDPVSEWLGLEESDGTRWIARSAGFLPSKLAAQTVERFQKHWRELLIAGRFDLAVEALRCPLPKSLATQIKRIATEVFAGLSPRNQAGQEENARLIFGPRWKPLKPPQVRWKPLAGTEDIQDVLDWFRQYRSELSWRSAMPAERVRAAQSFRQWYLDRDRFPRWCVEGERGQLSFRVNSIIRDAQHSHSAVLVVIVDGLGHDEHIRLLDDIYERTSSLHVHIDIPVFSVLPTITPICKGALLSGRPQRERSSLQPDYSKLVRDCARVNFRGRYLPSWDEGKVAEWLADADTSLVVVNHIELDSQLHDCRSGAAVEARIEGALAYLATSIASLIERVELELDSLGVIICSDHGQVVGPCRAVPPPAEVVQQRLRVASTGKQAHEMELLGSVSLCAEDYWFLDDDSAWSANGQEVFGCHGGVFPEEVITRVTLLSTTPSEPQIKVTASGTGVSGVSGNLTWGVTNGSKVEISVVRATVRYESQSISLLPLSHVVPANARRDAPEELLRDWPTQEQAYGALLEIEYVVAGKSLTASGAVSLSVTPGYESSVFNL
jgi:hypothetical protein